MRLDVQLVGGLGARLRIMEGDGGGAIGFKVTITGLGL
jgi:hypothetical protein